MTTSTDETKTEAVEAPQQERDRLMSQAYGAAQKDLREAHKKEFDGYYQQRCAERGIEWTPRKSKAEQALDQITDLLSEFPDIAEAVAERLAEQLEGAEEQKNSGD